MYDNPHFTRGFIALLSVILLSAGLMAIALAADYAAYVAHEAVVDEQWYRQAQQNGFSCARLAFSRLDADPLRFRAAATTSITLDSVTTCAILSASSSDQEAGALVSGTQGNSTVPLYVLARRTSSSSPFLVVSWTQY